MPRYIAVHRLPAASIAQSCTSVSQQTPFLPTPTPAASAQLQHAPRPPPRGCAPPADQGAPSLACLPCCFEKTCPPLARSPVPRKGGRGSWARQCRSAALAALRRRIFTAAGGGVLDGWSAVGSSRVGRADGFSLCWVDGEVHRSCSRYRCCFCYMSAPSHTAHPAVGCQYICRMDRYDVPVTLAAAGAKTSRETTRRNACVWVSVGHSWTLHEGPSGLCSTRLTRVIMWAVPYRRSSLDVPADGDGVTTHRRCVLLRELPCFQRDRSSDLRTLINTP